MFMWFKIGWQYQFSRPLSVWWLDQVLIILFKSLCKFWCIKGVSKKLISSRFMTFGANGVSTFQRIRLGVTWKISNVGLHIPWGFIVWPIESVWQFRFCHICRWLVNLRVCFKPCTTIYPRALKGIWKSQNL
jgi:hypothetical protein